MSNPATIARPAGASLAPRTYIAAYALCLRDGCLLLAHLAPKVTDGDKWTLPGDGLEFGEEPATGVLRELDEETGLAGTITGLAGIYSRIYHPTAERPWGPVHHLGILYWVDAHPGELRHEPAGSTDYCAWIPLADLASTPLVPLVEYALTLLKA